MKTYGLEMTGRLIIEKVQSIPNWNPYDEGRFIYVQDQDTYYLGGVKVWITLAKGSSKLTIDKLDIGLSFGQLHAGVIPVSNVSECFSDASNITKVLENLSRGTDIQNEAILDRHIKSQNINSTHLLTGYSTNGINASIIPCQNSLYGTQSNVQSVVDSVVNSVSISTRQKVQTTAWQYSPAEELYAVTIGYNSAQNQTVVIQCFDERGYMIIPSKIHVVPAQKKVTIWVPFKLVLDVVIIG